MKKVNRAIILLILSFVIIISGCTEVVPPDPPQDENTTHVSDFNGIDGLEKNYVYMWYPNGLNDKDNPYLHFQSERYAIQFATSEGKLTGIKPLDYDSKYFKKADFDDMDWITNMTYMLDHTTGSLQSDGTAKPSEDTNRLWARAIESGRNMQRADVISLNYLRTSGSIIASNFLGRIEIAASSEYFGLNYYIYNDSNTVLSNTALSFSIDFGLTYSDIEKINENIVRVADDSGKGFSFIAPSASEGINFEINENILTITKNGINLPSKETYVGFGVVVKPSTSVLTDQSIINQSQLTVSAIQTSPYSGRTQATTYDPNRGIYVVNTDGMLPGYAPYREDKLDVYEKIDMSITNNSDEDIKIPVVFEKKPGGDFNSLGYTPMIRAKNTKEPTGNLIQISKNWHTYDNADTAQYPAGHYKRYLEKVWSMCYAFIEVPKNSTLEFEYCVVIGDWGGVTNVSHSQLSLIGYAADWIWDQSVLGGWGENICYDPDRCLGRSLIDDVRPAFTKTSAGNFQPYHWGDNVGGADFLWYYYLDDDGQLKEGRIINQLVNYRVQGPNMTDVVYSGITADGAIETFINIRMGRTDDIVRAYYTVSYKVVKDISFSKLALFKLGAERYADTFFDKYAIGNDSEVLEDSVFITAAGKTVTETTGNNPWFMLYDSILDKEAANKMFVVRQYKANINGKAYSKPSYLLSSTNNGNMQPSIELSVPGEAGNTLKAGSIIDMVIEFNVLPNEDVHQNAEYYGLSDYMNESVDIFNTAQSALQQAKGNNLKSSVSVGSQRGKYPIEIDAASGNVKAQFTLTGGLGYTPIVINGIDNFSGYKLQIKEGNTWVDIIQSGSLGEINDFYQVKKMYDGTYQFVYNIKNSIGLSFDITNEYRFIKS